MNTVQSWIIFTSDQKDKTEAMNKINRLTLQFILEEQKLAVKCIGMFEGIAEDSFMIPWSVDNEQLVQRITRIYNQDCYLVIDANRHGSLHQTDGKCIESLGKYSTSTTKPDGDFTLINDQYIIFDGAYCELVDA